VAISGSWLVEGKRKICGFVPEAQKGGATAMSTPAQRTLPLPRPRGISVPRAAKMLGVSDDTVHRLIEDGSIKAFRYRKRGWWSVSFDSLVEYMNGLQEQP
jgi:excisionase family DNA binding protein